MKLMNGITLALTPALSRGERENRLQRLTELGAAECANVLGAFGQFKSEPPYVGCYKR